MGVQDGAGLITSAALGSRSYIPTPPASLIGYEMLIY